MSSPESLRSRIYFDLLTEPQRFSKWGCCTRKSAFPQFRHTNTFVNTKTGRLSIFFSWGEWKLISDSNSSTLVDPHERQGTLHLNRGCIFVRRFLSGVGYTIDQLYFQITTISGVMEKGRDCPGRLPELRAPDRLRFVVL